MKNMRKIDIIQIYFLLRANLIFNAFLKQDGSWNLFNPIYLHHGQHHK